MCRATQGVRLINLKGNDEIAAVTRVVRSEDEEDENFLEEGEGLDNGTDAGAENGAEGTEESDDTQE